MFYEKNLELHKGEIALISVSHEFSMQSCLACVLFSYFSAIENGSFCKQNVRLAVFN